MAPGSRHARRLALDGLHLQTHFQAMGLPQDAARFLLVVYEAWQVFDDFADGDPVKREDLHATLWNVFVGLPSNPFYQSHMAALIPALGTGILKWLAADTVERAGEADEVSFVWRAGFYDLVVLVAQLALGPAEAMRLAPSMLKLYGEKFADYRKEFP
jgi:hypothetical protein